MRVLVFISLHQAWQETKRVDQFTGEHFRPVLLTWTDLFLAALCKHQLELIFNQLKASNNEFVMQVEELSYLIE